MDIFYMYMCVYVRVCIYSFIHTHTYICLHICSHHPIPLKLAQRSARFSNKSCYKDKSVLETMQKVERNGLNLKHSVSQTLGASGLFVSVHLDHTYLPWTHPSPPPGLASHSPPQMPLPQFFKWRRTLRVRCEWLTSVGTPTISAPGQVCFCIHLGSPTRPCFLSELTFYSLPPGVGEQWLFIPLWEASVC